MDDVDLSFIAIENADLKARIGRLEKDNKKMSLEVDHMYKTLDIQDVGYVKLQKRIKHLKRALCLAAKILAGTVMCPKRSQQLCSDLRCSENEPPVRCWHKVIETSIQKTGALAVQWRDLLEEVTNDANSDT